MKIPEEFVRPILPAAYGLLMIEIAVDLGVSRDKILKGIIPNTAVLHEYNGNISHVQCGLLIERALTLTQRPEISIEFGLRNSPLIHGPVGHGLLSLPTVRDAMGFAIRYSNLVTIGIDTVLMEMDKSACIIFIDKIPPELINSFFKNIDPEKIRRCIAEMFTVGWWSVLHRTSIFTEATPTLHFDFPEPAYFSAYVSKLPPIKFNSDKLGIEFPLAVLDKQINLVDPIAARMAEAQCKNQLRSLGIESRLIDKVLSTIAAVGYAPHPRLELVAERLHTSSRTLKRRLKEQGTSYEKLLNLQRQEDCYKLLSDPGLSIDIIGQKLGYSSQNNFNRAFRGWTGTSPSAYRRQHLGEVD